MKLRLLENQTLELVIRDWGCGMEDVEQARQPLFTTGGEGAAVWASPIMESFMNQLVVKSAPAREPPSPCVSVSPPVSRRSDERAADAVGSGAEWRQ